MRDPHLADTNILLRLARRDDPEYNIVRAAVLKLQKSGAWFCYCSQNLVEFWNVATRPKSRNSFGLSVAEADREAQLIEANLELLPESPQIHQLWRRLVVAHSVSGVQVHDARLVATIHAHGIQHLLTFNVHNFSRYTEIAVLHPREVVGV